MPINQLTDPNAPDTLLANSGTVLETYVNGTTTTLVVGELVQIVTSFTGTGPVKVVKASKTGNFLTIGVVVGGKGPGRTVPKGTIAQVCVLGVCQALFAAGTITAGHLVIVSTATSGLCKTAAGATLGKTYGVVLQTKTIAATHTGLIWVRIGRF